MKDNKSTVKHRPARKKKSKELGAQEMWNALRVQHKVDETFKGRAQAEYDPKEKVCEPHHGNSKIKAQGEVN